MNARRQNQGFSLLEVIIATAILAASAVMLMSLFSTGDRHMARADERSIAQMLCQSKLHELIADPGQILPVEADVFRQYPGWVWSLEVQPTAIDGFVYLRVSVTRIPGMETGANLELAAAPDEAATDATSLSGIPEDPTFELTRFIRFDGDLDGFADQLEGGSRPSSAFERLSGGEL